MKDRVTTTEIRCTTSHSLTPWQDSSYLLKEMITEVSIGLKWKKWDQKSIRSTKQSARSQQMLKIGMSVQLQHFCLVSVHHLAVVLSQGPCLTSGSESTLPQKYSEEQEEENWCLQCSLSLSSFSKGSGKLEEKEIISKRIDFMSCFLLWILLLALFPGIHNAVQIT